MPKSALNRAQTKRDRVLSIVTDVAHQLATPLSILRERATALPSAAESESLVRQVDHLARLVTQLTACARVGSLTLQPDSRFPLDALARDVVSAQAPLAAARGRSLSCIGADTDLWVHGDYNSAFEALSNLVNNALNHTDPQTTVTVWVHPDGTVDVQDRGPGVPEDERELIFERGRQGRAPTEGGAGIGLAVVRDVMRAHGGAVVCTARPGGGAVFSLSFRPAIGALQDATPRTVSAGTDPGQATETVPPATRKGRSGHEAPDVRENLRVSG